MNTIMSRNGSFRCLRIVAALLAGVFLISKAPAQPETQPVENRFLLVFDTSSDMKSRLPAAQLMVDSLLASSMRGQLRAGDSIAVWTFGQELRADHLVQPWVPENAAKISANILGFVTNQRYSKKTSFDALRPSLNGVVQNSDRLTVLIFSDGYGQMTGTPYDSDINRVFQQQRAERKKRGQPFLLVLRSQLGNYTGCTMDSPPALVNFPEFPPLPQPPLAITNAPPPSPPRPSFEAPPLIVIGTRTATNAPPPKPALPPPPPPITNQPPPTVAASLTNANTNVETNPSPLFATVKPTNVPVALPVSPVVPAAAGPAKTTPPPPLPAPENSSLSTLKALMIGGVLLGMAGVLVVLMLGRAHKADHGSLITRSMDKSGKPPARR